MRFTRRGVLGIGGAAIGVGAVTFAATRDTGPEPVEPKPEAARPSPPPPRPDFSKLASGDDWDEVRRQFAFSPEVVHLSALLIASHPAPVRARIEEYRAGLDADPVQYLQENNDRLRDASMAAAAKYLGIEPKQVALTESTTMGLGLVYHGLQLKPGQEILTTEQDYYVTYEATRLAARRSGASVRRIPLFEDIDEVAEPALVERVVSAIRPETRVLALTWVHSSSGLKMPIRKVADALAEINVRRAEPDQVLFVVDGVHGFANQDATMESLGCDFLVAGCHKWLFGPRGTGIVATGKRGYRDVMPTIPSFTDGAAWSAWQKGKEPPDSIQTGWGFMPGGFKAFEHQWALAEAFAFHERIGKAKIAERTARLASRLKDGLADIAHVRLVTPRAPELSAGIVSFDIDGFTPNAAAKRLREHAIVASVAPYARPHVRLTPSLANTPAEIDYALQAIAEIRPPQSATRPSGKKG